MATHSSILAWEIPGQRSLGGYSPRGRKESDTTEHTQHTASDAQPCDLEVGPGAVEAFPSRPQVDPPVAISALFRLRE